MRRRQRCCCCCFWLLLLLLLLSAAVCRCCRLLYYYVQLYCLFFFDCCNRVMRCKEFSDFIFGLLVKFSVIGLSIITVIDLCHRNLRRRHSAEKVLTASRASKMRTPILRADVRAHRRRICTFALRQSKQRKARQSAYACVHNLEPPDSVYDYATDSRYSRAIVRHHR